MALERPDIASSWRAVRQGGRFGRGMLRFLRESIDADAAVASYVADLGRRTERLATWFDRMVWTVPHSPYRPLLDHAGIGPMDIRQMLATTGLEPTLEGLRDEGVYVAYEEYLGRTPIRRGSLEVAVDPSCFHNPRVVPDYFGGSGGTRSGGVSVQRSFAGIQREAERIVAVREAENIPTGSPTAVWFPCLPSAAGLGASFVMSALGLPPERWFSQLPANQQGVPATKRIANALVSPASRIAGARLPAPEHVPSDEPEAVVEWCRGRLAESGRAVLAGYPSSIVRLAAAAIRAGVSLEGLVVGMSGEPVTAARRQMVVESGARVLAVYAFTQVGLVGTSCAHGGSEEYHLLEPEFGLVTRRRRHPDGHDVDAFLWTTLGLEANTVLLNVENDDYGTVVTDDEPCACGLGHLGVRRRLRDPRGMSKVVAGGATVLGEVFETLVERDLPARFGGSPLDFQFTEDEVHGETHLVVRVDPTVVDVDDSEVVGFVRTVLARSEAGVLASGLWQGDTLRVEHGRPRPAPSGKILPFEPLGVAVTAR